MAFIPKQNPCIGAEVRLLTYVQNTYGTFEQGTTMYITDENEDGFNLIDEYGHSVSGVDKSKFAVIK